MVFYVFSKLVGMNKIYGKENDYGGRSGDRYGGKCEK